MGRRSINTTKSGKYMNPTDQARKEARKRELKKNKKQRTMVRMAVLKGKDPSKLIEEMDAIDEMEFDPTQPPVLSERVLKDKRKKLKETFDRVFKMYEREDPEFAMDLRKKEVDYEKRHEQRLQYYAQVKNAEQVQLDQIPLPDMPSIQPMAAQIPLPVDIPLPHKLTDDDSTPKGILKKGSVFQKGDLPDHVPIRLPKRKPPGPPPGPPPELSDTEEPMEKTNIEESKLAKDSIKKQAESEEIEKPVKHRKIRFEDDGRNSGEEEKDTRLKYKHPVNPVSALQAKMLQIAGQELPTPAEAAAKEDRRRESNSVEDRKQHRQDGETERRHKRRHSSDDESDDESRREVVQKAPAETAKPTAPLAPPGPPPGLPPGPPPGLPPMMFRPPPLRAPPGAPPRMLPPGPPPGRPPGMPPGPPPGMPPNMRPVQPRMPPGIPPMRIMRPSLPNTSSVPTPSQPVASAANPNVLSAPPSIMKPASKLPGDESKSAATIEAKPKIKNWNRDVTRFMPTALKIKRDVKDARGRVIKPGTAVSEESSTVKVNPTVQAQMKDDAYETFMKEMENFL